MAQPPDDRDAVVAQLTRALAPRVEVLLALLHGSFERGEPFRDVDVAVWLDDDLVAPAARVEYVVDLGERLTTELGWPIDLRVLNGAPLGFRYHALRGRPLVARDQEFLDELRARTWGEYFDFQPLARAFLRDALGG